MAEIACRVDRQRVAAVGREFVEEVHNAVLAVGSGHHCHARQPCDFVGLQLCVAAGNEYGRLRKAAVQRTYGLAALFVGQFGYAAGIYHNYIGSFARSNPANAFLGQLACNG